MVDTAPSISTNDTIFDVGDTLYVTITFNGSVGGYLYVGDTEISIVAPKNVSSYTYSYDLTTSGVYNVHFYDYLNMLDSNIIAITVNNSTSSSAFLTKITKVKTALENVFVKKSDVKNNLTSTDVDKPLSANQGKVLNDNKEDKSNKSSNITTDTGSTTKYPTVKAVEDYAQPIGNYLTSHQSLTDYIQKSQTNGLVKNDGSIDTTSYSTFSGSYNDLSNKPSIPSDVSDLTDTSNTAFTPKSHTHSSSDVTGLTATRNVCTDSNGNLSTEYKNNHSHGSIGSSGTINSDITSTDVNKIIVTNSSNQIKTISSLPSSKISNLDTLTATVNYTDNTSETVTFYIVPNNSS